MSAMLVQLTADELRALVNDAVTAALAEHERPTADRGPLLVSGGELARLLGISRTSVHRLRLEGCPTVKLGDTYRYRPADVLAWLETRSARGEAAA